MCVTVGLKLTLPSQPPASASRRAELTDHMRIGDSTEQNATSQPSLMCEEDEVIAGGSWIGAVCLTWATPS